MAYMLEVDHPTAELIVQIQLQDAGLFSEVSKSKSRDPTDEELAFQLQNEQLKAISNFLKDRRIAISFAAAVQADGRILAQTKGEEESRWMDDEHLVSGNDFEAETAGLDDETLAKLEILYVSGLKGYYNTEDGSMTGAETEQAELSAWAAGRPRQLRSQIRQCVACGDDAEFFNVARVPCQHEYCRSCLEALFKASITDESLFPPRCCRQPINLSTARIFLKFDRSNCTRKRRLNLKH